MDQTTTGELKRDLYRALLLKGDRITENEIDMAYLLCYDPEVQKILREAAEKQ